MTEYRHGQPEIGSSLELEFQSNDFGSDLEPITDLSCGRNERQVADKHYNRMNSSLLPISSRLRNSRMNQSSFPSFCHSSYLLSVKTRRKWDWVVLVSIITWFSVLTSFEVYLTLQYGERKVEGPMVLRTLELSRLLGSP